jgi:hypothetical protein
MLLKWIMEMGRKAISCIGVAQMGDNCVFNISGIANGGACPAHFILFDLVVFTVSVEGELQIV